MNNKAFVTPEFIVGDVIASEVYMGKITGAFWAEGTWNYNLGENADLEKADGFEGHRVGMKYIKRGDIKWHYKNGDWKEV